MKHQLTTVVLKSSSRQTDDRFTTTRQVNQMGKVGLTMNITFEFSKTIISRWQVFNFLWQVVGKSDLLVKKKKIIHFLTYQLSPVNAYQLTRSDAARRITDSYRHFVCSRNIKLVTLSFFHILTSYQSYQSCFAYLFV